VSVCVQALPSLQADPSAFSGFEHAPVAVSQAPASWHWSEGLQITGFAPVHAPAWHVSSCVQALPSSQADPSAFAGFEHAPVAESQTPTSWHGSEAAQTTGFDPVQVPAWHVSVCVQALPSLQAAPSAFAGVEHVPVAVSHTPATWH
jgi:hypothetical protein